MLNSKVALNVLSIVFLSVLPIAVTCSEVRSEVSTQVSDNQAQKIDALVQQLKTDGLSLDQDVIEQLAAIGESTIPKLLPLLNNPSGQVRWNAILVLRKIGQPASTTRRKLP